MTAPFRVTTDSFLSFPVDLAFIFDSLIHCISSRLFRSFHYTIQYCKNATRATQKNGMEQNKLKTKTKKGPGSRWERFSPPPILLPYQVCLGMGDTIHNQSILLTVINDDTFPVNSIPYDSILISPSKPRTQPLFVTTFVVADAKHHYYTILYYTIHTMITQPC